MLKYKKQKGRKTIWNQFAEQNAAASAAEGKNAEGARKQTAIRSEEAA